MAQEHKFTAYETTEGRELIGSTDVFGEATAAIMRRVALDPSVPADMADRRRMETPGEVWHFTDAGRSFEVVHVQEDDAQKALSQSGGIDLNDDGEVIASRLSMEHYAAQEHPGRLIAWSPNGESYSATAGDYFAVDSDEWLEDSEGIPMVLAYVMPERVEPVKIPGPAAVVEQKAVQACTNLADYLNAQEQWNGGDVCEVLAQELRKVGYTID